MLAGISFSAIVEAITAFFKYPDAVIRLIRVLRNTPQENHEKLVGRIEEEAKNFEDTGRPTWG